MECIYPLEVDMATGSRSRLFKINYQPKLNKWRIPCHLGKICYIWGVIILSKILEKILKKIRHQNILDKKILWWNKLF